MDELNPSRVPSRCSASAFTLLEVLVALGILAFGLLTVATAQLHAMRNASSARHTTRAAVIAQVQLEDLQRRPWAALAPTAWTAPVAVDEVIEAPTNEIEQRYQVSWRVSDLVVGETRSIDVRVNWNEPNRGAREFVLSTVRFNL